MRDVPADRFSPGNPCAGIENVAVNQVEGGGRVAGRSEDVDVVEELVLHRAHALQGVGHGAEIRRAFGDVNLSGREVRAEEGGEACQRGRVDQACPELGNVKDPGLHLAEQACVEDAIDREGEHPAEEASHEEEGDSYLQPETERDPSGRVLAAFFRRRTLCGDRRRVVCRHDRCEDRARPRAHQATRRVALCRWLAGTIYSLRDE
jgi:hypothetical protein